MLLSISADRYRYALLVLMPHDSSLGCGNQLDPNLQIACLTSGQVVLVENAGRENRQNA